MNCIIVKKLKKKIEIVVSRYQVPHFRHPSDIWFRPCQLFLAWD
jgi:hypothetical protein